MKMPLDGLEEEGLPKIPDLRLVQLKFLLTVEDGLGVDKESTWKELLEAMTKDGKSQYFLSVFTIQPLSFSFTFYLFPAMAPFYSALCTELGRPLDSDLLSQMEKENKKQLEKLEEGIEDAEKNFGETEQRDALLAKAEYLCKIGDKVRERERERERELAFLSQLCL